MVGVIMARIFCTVGSLFDTLPMHNQTSGVNSSFFFLAF